MMKKAVIYLFVLVLLLQLVVASTSSVNVDTDASSEVKAQIEVVKYQPSPVEPGEYFDLWIALEIEAVQSDTSIINLDNMQGVELEFVENDPFSLAQGEDAVKDFGVMKMGESSTVTYRLYTDEDAVTGDNEIQFIFYSTDDPEGVLSPALDINVYTLDATMNVVEITTEPDQLSPGKPATLDVTIRNDAQTLFKNIETVLNINDVDIPLVPYKASKEQTLRSLDSGEEHTFTFDIIAEEDAEAGVYKIPLELSYKDINNTLFVHNDTFGILIGAEADLSYNLEEFDIFQDGSTGEVVVSISNIGPTELKFMNLEMLDSESYTVLEANKEYLGNLESDDFETSRFKIYVENGEEVELLYKVTYKDTYNEEYEETFSLDLPIYSPEEMAMYGLDGDTSSSLTYLFYLIAVVFLYLVYRGWREEKRLDKGIWWAIKMVLTLPFRILFLFHPRNLGKSYKKIKLFFKSL